MTDTKEKDPSIYEVGYLIVSSIPEEKVPGEAETIKKIITGAGSAIIAEEAPRREPLAYTIQKKTVSGGYDRYDDAHFGWVKFEVGSDQIEAIKKAIELHPTVLRSMLITTLRENTYLGKRAPSAAPVAVAALEEKKEAAPVSIEEMDKSIDNMVKEV